MEGYTNLSGNHQDFDDLDIERRPTDDWNSDFGKHSAKELDEEQARLLELKVKLIDGTYGYVFSLRRRDNVLRWRCHLCDVVIVSQPHVETHIQSKKHQIKLAIPAHDRFLFSRIEGQNSLEIAAGEPVPPGFEDTIVLKKGVPQIQAMLDCHKSSPLIGLEYLIELVPDERDNEPMYVCVLCDKKGDPRIAMAHITSFNHRSKYIGINFPTANRAVNSGMPRTKAGRKGVSDLVTNICAKIEEKHGRLMPLVLQQQVYEARKEFYHRQIENDRHFRESADENYMDMVEENVLRPYSINLDEVPLPEKAPPVASEDPKRKIAVDRSRLRTHASKEKDKQNIKKEADSSSDKKAKDEFDKPKKRRNSLSSISSVSSSSLSRSPSPARTRSRSKTPLSSPSPPLTKSYRDNKSRDRNRSSHPVSRYRNRSRSRSPRFSRRPSRSRSHSRSNSKSRYRGGGFNRRSPPRSKTIITSLTPEKTKWEKFRMETNKIERQLTKELKFHEKNPEKHPRYPEEWKKFWNVRYKQIQAEGKDPSSHDFKPEWITFWNKRMKELHEDEFRVKREELRQKCSLPKDEPNSHHFSKQSRLQEIKPSRLPDPDDEVIVISPDPSLSRDFFKSNRNSKHDSREKKRSLSPWDKDDIPQKSSRKQSWANPRYSNKGRDRNAGYTSSARPLYKEVDPESDAEGGARVITVVRLLTAMEAQLGSFGPTVNNLLASALAMEKIRRGSSESMLSNPDNLVFFETVKEKLKGQLFAGIVEPGLVMATRSCIQNLAEMLYRAESMPSIKEKPPGPSILSPVISKTLPVPAEPVSVPGVGAVDKAKIATQIAAALVAQGRGNVTQDELESLINAVIGMAQASATLDKPITTAAFVSQMQPQVSEASPPKVAVSTPPVQEKSSLETLLSVVNSKPTLTTSQAETHSVQAKPVVEEPVRSNNTCLFPCMAENEEPVERERTPSPRTNMTGMNIADMEELTEADLKALLQNFKDLSTKEQYCLITYLKKIEATEPDRVENLRQFVNLPPSQAAVSADKNEEKTELSGRLSPFSLRLGRSNPTLDDSSTRYRQQDAVEVSEKIHFDDSDEEYSFEDIYEAASKKLKEKETAAKDLEQKQADEASFSFVKAIPEKTISPAAKELTDDDPGKFLRETEQLIANLMGHLPEKYNKNKTSTPSPKTVKPSTPLNADWPSRPNVGLNIDISNNLIDAENNFTPDSANTNKSGSDSNVNVRVSPGNEHESNVSYEESSTATNNKYDPSNPTTNDFNDHYRQQAFQNPQYPEATNSFNGQGYQGVQPEYTQGGYPQQQCPQQGYQNNYGPNNFVGSFEGTPAQVQFPQQYGHPQQYNAPYQQQPMGRGGFLHQPQGYPPQRPGVPPYRPNVPAQGYPSQYGGQGQYNQYPQQQQGFY